MRPARSKNTIWGDIMCAVGTDAGFDLAAAGSAPDEISRRLESLPASPYVWRLVILLSLGGWFEDFKLASLRQRWHGQIATARPAEGRGRIIAGDSDFVFRFDIKRFQFVVGDGPVFE